MKAKILPFALIRCSGLYFLYGAAHIYVETLSQYFIWENHPTDVIIHGLMDSVVPLLCFWLFWYKSEWLVSKIMGNYANEEMQLNFTSEELERTGFALLGMFLLAGALISSAHSVLMIATLRSPEHHALANDASAYLNARVHEFTSTFQFVVSLFLIFGANGISRIIKKMRHG